MDNPTPIPVPAVHLEHARQCYPDGFPEFHLWLAEIDYRLYERTGSSDYIPSTVGDFPDYEFPAAYNAGCTPTQVTSQLCRILDEEMKDDGEYMEVPEDTSDDWEDEGETFGDEDEPAAPGDTE